MPTAHRRCEVVVEEPLDPMIEDLSVSTCWALIRTVPIGRIALPGTDDIEIFPVNFVVDGGSIVFRTAPGTKRTLIGDGVRCSFEADHIDVGEQLVWSVVLKGPVRPVLGHEAIIATFDMEVPAWQAGPKPTYVRMKPQLITGRRFPIVAH
jgi:nitroimidazol reductase NimA-like FMN-containing flavoprotein (pyridoxamine 5'-phosphate oxidase superfamily)